MIRILLLAALVTLAACWEDGPSSSRETSPGGIEYTLLDLPEHEDVTIHVAWPTDWAYRSGTGKAAPVTGAQVILAGGAEGHPAGVVVERFADLGSEGNIHVEFNDHVIGELTFERDRMAETVGIANAHLRAPALDQAWFERIRHGIAQNMAEAQARHVHAGYDAVRWAVFGTQPLRNAMSLDEPGTFEALTRDDVAAWHAETFTRNPEAVVVAAESMRRRREPPLTPCSRGCRNRDGQCRVRRPRTFPRAASCCTGRMRKSRTSRSSRPCRRPGWAGSLRT